MFTEALFIMVGKKESIYMHNHGPPLALYWGTRKNQVTLRGGRRLERFHQTLQKGYQKGPDFTKQKERKKELLIGNIMCKIMNSWKS